MGSHASQLTKTERWQVVLFVQTLQRKKKVEKTDTAPMDSTTALVLKK
jgi:hypothetical protein